MVRFKKFCSGSLVVPLCLFVINEPLHCIHDITNLFIKSTVEPPRSGQSHPNSVRISEISEFQNSLLQ